MSIVITFYAEDQIDAPLFAWLLESRLYQEGDSGKYSSLKKTYKRMLRLGIHQITHLWLLSEDAVPIGIAVLEGTVPRGFQFFVKPEHRFKGYGSQLLEQALQTGIEFGVYYTGMARPLFEKHHLANLCEASELPHRLRSSQR